MTEQTIIHVPFLAGISIGIILGFIAAYILLKKAINAAVQGGMMIAGMQHQMLPRGLGPDAEGSEEDRMKVKNLKEVYDEKIAAQKAGDKGKT